MKAAAVSSPAARAAQLQSLEISSLLRSKTPQVHWSSLPSQAAQAEPEKSRSWMLWKTGQDETQVIILSSSGRKLNHTATSVAAYRRAERKQKAGEAKEKGGRWEAEAKITGKEMSQGRCKSREEPWQIFPGHCYGAHTSGGFFCPDECCPQELSSEIHRLPQDYTNFQAQLFSPCYKPKPRWEVSNIFCPQGQLVQPWVWKAEIRSKQPESRIISWKHKQENKSCPEDGQHSSSTQSSCLWFAWHKN